ncbi:mannosyltransferase [Dechloromonas denitrificans]|uniref:Mannosyltransferase n=1 Tax=Dechloromonas denitrificans TaxID=281362 RepID=A0A133XGS3_9RHOO|nr:glycosyltransferase [Dechloromonas denitrificans]KXB30134.1 mannosyltransferase [Dechloromonas denitrificans]
MLNLRVLITTYHEAYLTRGGGEYELQSIADGLRQLGIIVDIYGPYSRSLAFYDVVLHFSVHVGGLSLLREIRRQGKPVVLWPNLWAGKLGNETIDSVREHIDIAHFVAFKSRAEQDRFLEQIPVTAEKLALCRWVADLSYLKPAPADLFSTLYKIRDYAIWFGIVEPVKNQLAAIRVLKKKAIPLVVVGKYRDEAYMQACRELGGDNVLFIEALPQKSEIVRSALQSAGFYVELSLEPPGLSAIEAGLSGCRLLLSESEWARELFGDKAVLVDPLSDLDVAQGVDRVLARPAACGELRKHLMAYCFPNALTPLVDLLVKAAR